MRLLRQISHDHFKVCLHQYNDKYLLSIVLDDYEQHFKVPTSEISNLDQLEKNLDAAFYTACLKDFVNMRSRWLQLLRTTTDE